MILGSVDASEQAIVPLRIRSQNGSILQVETVIDTGFSDWLTLSKAEIENLRLSFREEARYTMADGSVVASRLFTAEIEWLDGWRRILVVEMDGGPLLGMATLRGSHLAIEVIAAGRVEIKPLASSS